MISIIGHFTLSCSFIFSLLGILLHRKNRLICFNIGSLLPIFDLFVLIYAFITSDFSIRSVFLNSSKLLPSIYKVSACWASHEGSILLWYSLLCIASFMYIYLSSFSMKAKELGVAILSSVQMLFCSFIIFTSNPFNTLSFIPKEGLGLNPMLQDIALVVHPPILYMGLVSYIGIFVGGLLLIYMPHEKKEILQINKVFSNFALMSLTCGIGLGSWWAYRELGWGGYWFFDPVENISLLPWISSIVLHHFMILSIRNNQYIYWTIFLSLLCFLLTIYGTLIVRSGIISSIHAFAFSNERGVYIFFICATLTIFSFGSILLRKLSVINLAINYNIESYAILLANILWVLSLIILIISLLYPVCSSLVNGIDIVIDPEYFKSVYIPIHIPILILAAVVPSLSKKNASRKILIFCSAIGTTIYLSILIPLTFMKKIFCFASIYLIMHSCDYLLCGLKKYSFWTLKSKYYSLFLGHFGFGLLALSITLNSSLSQELEFIGKTGHKVKNQEVVATLKDIQCKNNFAYFYQSTEFLVEILNKKTVTLKPENRLYKVENTLSQEASVYSYLFHDIYAILHKIDKKNIVHAKIYYQPFINLIWLSIAFISCGFMLLLFKKNKS